MCFSENFTINSPLPPAFVRRKLLEVVEPHKIKWEWQKSGKPYVGEIGEEVFRIHKNINYRNSFLPIITGRIKPQGLGSQIEIQMKLHPAVMIFMFIWLGTIGQVALLSSIAMLVERNLDPIFLMLWGMFAFGVLLVWVGFKPEANGAKRFLMDLLS